jgi:PAS domain S-box-containing protein
MPKKPRDPRATTALETEDEVTRLPADHRLVLDIIEHGDALYVLDSHFRFVLVNEAQERISRKPRSETLGRVLWDVFPESAKPERRYWREYHRCMEERTPVAFEEYYAPLDVWAAVAAYPTSAGGIAVFFRDITKQKQTEEALRESESRYRMLFQNMLDGFAYCRMLFDERGCPNDFVYLDVNAAFSRLTGLRDVVGKRVTEVLPGVRESQPELLETYGRVARSGQPERFEIDFQPLKSWLSISVYSPQPDHFVAVFDNITDRKRAEQALRESDQRKSEFLAMLSHELRNPLAPVRNALWILENAERSDQAAAARATLNRQVMHLTRIVDDLLDVTRVARGKIDLQKVRIDLGDVVRRAVEDYRTLFSSRDVSLELSVEGGPLAVDADPVRLGQVLGNLLHNAAKFTSPGGRAGVVVGLDAPGTAVVTVRDDGVGIAPELLHLVFEAFTQGEMTLARSRGGLGLGLALVKGLVELHGGSVEARSDGPGRGAEFLVRIPLAPERAALNEPARPAATAMPQRRVLVIEDNIDAAETLGEMLRLWGHEVAVAHDGRAGLEKARTFTPDVVLCDIGLPVMDGYQVCRAIRNDPALAHTFLVALTGYTLAEDQRRAAAAGFDRHLGKPVAIDVIEDVLANPPSRA